MNGRRSGHRASARLPRVRQQRQGLLDIMSGPNDVASQTLKPVFEQGRDHDFVLDHEDAGAAQNIAFFRC